MSRIRISWRRCTLALGVLAALAACLALTNCASILARAMVHAPNKGRGPGDLVGTHRERLAALGIHREMRLEVGPPPAVLSIWIIHPAGPDSTLQEGAAPSVIVLHGIRDGKDGMVGLGKMYAAAGYRAVLVDLRGQGRSSGDWLTYGVVEARDLSQVIDRLIEEGLADERIGLMGASYGGATAIQLAGIDPRVRAVVAVAPFTAMAEVVPLYVRRYLPAWLISDACISESVAKAGRMAGFDPGAAAPLDAIKRTSARVLLIHGEEDRKIPCSHSRALFDARREGSKLILVDGEGHDSIMGDRTGAISAGSREWFGKWIAR